MGFVLIKESMSFVPSDWGITDGTKVHVYAVGSGAGGSSKKDGGYGGASGRAGTTVCGGGGGGGFGGGGGGGFGGTQNRVNIGGKGGGAGEFKYAIVTIGSAATAIAVTIGQPVARDTNGEASSFGSYLTAAGGEINKGGAGARHPETYDGGGGGGGGGGFQLCGMIYGGLNGANLQGYDPAADSTGTAGGNGANHFSSKSNALSAGTLGGKYGGGHGGIYNKLNTEISVFPEDGYCFLGEPGQGCVLLMW